MRATCPAQMNVDLCVRGSVYVMHSFWYVIVHIHNVGLFIMCCLNKVNFLMTLAHICLYLFNFKPGYLVVNKSQTEILAFFNLSGVVLLHCKNGCMQLDCILYFMQGNSTTVITTPLWLVRREADFDKVMAQYLN